VVLFYNHQTGFLDFIFGHLRKRPVEELSIWPTTPQQALVSFGFWVVGEVRRLGLFVIWVLIYIWLLLRNHEVINPSCEPQLPEVSSEGGKADYWERKLLCVENTAFTVVTTKNKCSLAQRQE